MKEKLLKFGHFMRFDRKKNTMTEQEIISVCILGERKQLTKQDFIDFTPLINVDQVISLQTPCSKFYQKYSVQKNRLLNILLYYVMSIQLNYEIMANDNHGNEYRNLCIKKITHYYLKNHMNIELRQFSFLTSKILGTKYHESAHIIFYLIYGRFASHPYINYLCYHQQNSFINTHNRNTRGFQSTRKSKKKTTTITNNSMLSEVKGFCKQLRAVLHSQNTARISNRYQTQRRIEQKDQKQKSKSKYLAQRKQLNIGSKYNTFVPNTIKKAQNTHILQNLSFQRTQQNYRDYNRKGLMRKQKFNNYFNADQMKENIKLKKNINQIVKEKSISQIKQKDLTSLQIGKFNIVDIQKIAGKLKQQGNQLDIVRECAKIKQYMSDQNRKQQQKMKQQQAKNEESLKSKTNNYFKQAEQDPNSSNPKLSKTHKLLTLSKSFSKQQKQSQQIGNINLLRIEQTIKQNQRLKYKPNQFYIQTFIGIKNINCKEKVKLYKSQYKKFLKLELFDKVRESTQTNK